MRTVLWIGAVISFLFGFNALITAPEVAQEFAALILFLTASVFVGSAVVVEAILSVRNSVDRIAAQLEKGEEAK